MGRTYLGGAIAIGNDQVRAAMEIPFLGLCVVDQSETVRVRTLSLAELEPCESRHDTQRGVWFFKLDLHDDDLPNADVEPVLRFLETVPSIPGAAFVASRDAWMEKPDWFALVLDGRAIERHIVDDAFAEEDPALVSRAQAAELIARVNWPPAFEVFDHL